MKIMGHLQRVRLDDTLFMRVAGGVFVGLGLFFISSGKLTTLTCNRVEANKGNCHLISSGLFGLHGKQSQAIEVHGAQLADNPMDDDASRVILLTNNGYVPFTSSTSDHKAEATASDINTFVQQGETTSLTIHQDERSLYFSMGGFIIAVGLFTLMFSRTSRLNA